MSEEKFIKIKLIHAEWKNFLNKVQIIINPQQVELKSQYLPLTPVTNADEDRVYTEMLKTALYQKGVKNIAITGPYGAGKSSVLRTFQESNPNWVYLNISLATFKDPSNADTSEDKISKELEIEAVEKSILQQLFYSVDQKTLPRSRLKRIVTTSSVQLIIYTAFITIWAILAAYIVFPKSVLFENFEILKKFSPIIKNTINIIFISFCITALYISIKYIEKVKELKLKLKDTEITLNNNPQESILNKHLDEILYFFERTDFNIIIIEDLDRFDNTEIFIRLRELNNLINSSQQIKRDIFFLYAIKDDMFKNKDRSKFFDFIIPIIPIINPTNSYDLIRDNYINEKIDKNLYERIDDKFLHQISLYFDDLRLVVNIFNEFKLYIKKHNNPNLNENKLLGLITYKNYYPADFADLHSNKGLIYEIFNNKKKFIIENLIESIDLEIKEIETEIISSESEKINSIEELRKIYIYEIFKRFPIINQISRPGYRINTTQISYLITLKVDDKEIDYNNLTTNENFKILNNSQNIEWVVEFQNNDSNVTANIKNIEETKFSFRNIEASVHSTLSYLKREKNIMDREEKNRKKILDQKQDLINKKLYINQNSLKEIISTFQLNDFFDSKKHPTLLQFLIREGYIDEQYPHYISFFREGVISSQERDYALSVIEQKNLDFSISLKNIDKLFDKYLTARQFNHSSILNFDMVDYMIKNRELLSDHFKNLFILLSNEEDRSKEFITAYIDRGTNSTDFANAIISYWENFFEYLLTSLTKEQLENYLYNILASLTEENIKKLNKDNHLRDYISSKENFIIFIKKIYGNQNHIFNFLSILSPIFDFLKCNHEDLALFNEICKKEYFSFNKPMILQIILLNNETKDHNEIQVNFDSMPYGIVQIFSPEYLKIQIDNSLDHYFEEVFIPSSQNLAENSDNFIKLLNTKTLSKAHKEWLIKNNKVKIDLITDIHVNELWELLLINNRVEPSWDSLIEYYKNNDQALDSAIIDYINLEENYNLLESQEISESTNGKDMPTITENFEEVLLESNLLNDAAYKVIVKVRVNNYPYLNIFDLAVPRISFLIESNTLLLTLKNIESLRSYSIDLVRDLVIKNLSEDCIELDEDLGLTTEELEAILLSKKLENSKKIIIVKKLGITFYNKTMIKLAINDIFNNTQSSLPIEYIYSFFEGSYPTSKKLEILISQISNFDHSNITNLLNLLDEPYNTIPEIGSHTIKYSESNEYLINALKRINYINGVRVNYSKSFLGTKSKSSITFITK
ncbi:hypothetical protein APC62_05280 [Acinetobacter pittii]|uniref:YobI family P-loop NTPase n=1 Tax=Acinetobacter pittii TaxID=48296 RepID=UPI00070B92B0|nr:hypothetical protein [Acinetobacter pittii]KRI64086.1 hypothetical protein APC62_05280 [Acinetobacter pittii]